MPRPIAFMVMPFGVKETGRTEDGIPAKIDFDELWAKVYEPVLGRDYQAVRADRDVGALIIVEMIQRLTIADLVVADITLANANVYYEIGVRHAARRDSCVLVSTDWARPVFDLAQIRQLRFPLTDGEVGDAAAGVAVKAGVSPVFAAVPGFPEAPELDRLTAFQAAVAELSEFNADVRGIRDAPEDERRGRVQALLDHHGGRRVVRESVVLELLRLVRDDLGWAAVLDYIQQLPESLARHPTVLEQQALALSGTGDAAGAAGRLSELIAAQGETPERCGLLGGRYKALYRAAESKKDKRRYLSKAIDAYRRGMVLDLNAYYAASNLPGLYRERGEPGDEQLADEAAGAAALACKAAIAKGTADEWARPTLLGLAFYRADVPEAIRLRAEIEREGPDRWKLDTTLKDLRATVGSTTDEETRAGLQAVLDQLTELLED
jgi:hypothetical protein